jgi:hypothetical protein
MNNTLKTNVKVYVGKWEDRPIGVAVIPCFEITKTAHPRDFHKIFENFVSVAVISIFSNNLSVVQLFSPENVMVCKDGKCKPLTEHPDYERWKNELDSAEMWSLWGEDWV